MAVVQFPRAVSMDSRRVMVGDEEVSFPWPVWVVGKTFDGDPYQVVNFSGLPTVELQETEQTRLSAWPSALPSDVHLVLRRHSTEQGALAYVTAIHDIGPTYAELGACSVTAQGQWWFTMALRRAAPGVSGGGLVFVVEVERRMIADRDGVMVDLGPYRIDDITFQAADGTIYVGDKAATLSGFIPTAE